MSFYELEDTLSLLQFTLVAQRTVNSPEVLTWAQYDVLEILRIKDGLTPSELSQQLGISRQNLSKSLRVLKKNDYITQTQSEEDRRELITHITLNGQQFLSNADTINRHNAEKVFSTLSRDEQNNFILLSQKVITAINSSC